MQPQQLRCIAKQHSKDFGVIVLRNADWRRDPKRLKQVRNRVAMSDDERVAVQGTQFLDKCANVVCRNYRRSDLRRSRCWCRSFLRPLEFGNEYGRNLRILQNMRQRIRAFLPLDRQIRIFTACACLLCVTNNEDNWCSVGVALPATGKSKELKQDVSF